MFIPLVFLEFSHLHSSHKLLSHLSRLECTRVIMTHSEAAFFPCYQFFILFIVSVTLLPLCTYSTLSDSVLNGNLVESGNSYFPEWYVLLCLKSSLPGSSSAPYFHSPPVFFVVFFKVPHLLLLLFFFFANLTNSAEKKLYVWPFL